MKETYSHEFKGWQKVFQKLLGMWRINIDSVDFKWGYFVPKFGFELMLHQGGYFDQHYAISFCPIWGHFHIKLPFRTKLEEGCDMPQYGFKVFGNTLWIHAGYKEFDKQIGQVTKPRWWTFYAPWVWEHEKHLVLGTDGLCHKYVSFNKDYEEYKETWPFVYTLKSGEIQVRHATCEVHFRQWRWNWLLKLSKKLGIKPFGPKNPWLYIDISFSEEIGERSGTWKGGTVGCSYSLKEGETIKTCLNRMQDERTF
jgi:hypothetical protein